MYSVLIADDEPYVTEGLKLMIDWARYGFAEPEGVMSGTEALERLCAGNSDLAVIDINMPGIDGLKLIEELKRRGYPGEIIILTGYTEVDYARRAMNSGVKYFINKPVDVDEFCDILAEAKRSLDARGVLKGGIGRAEGLEAAKRRDILRGNDKTYTAAGVLVIYTDGYDADESLIAGEAYIYERGAEFISLLIGSGGDFNDTAERIFNRLKARLPKLCGFRAAMEGRTIEKCHAVALRALCAKVNYEDGALYDAHEPTGGRLSPKEIADHADHVMEATELCDEAAADRAVDAFFGELEDREEPESCAMVFSTYVLLRCNRIILRCGADPDMLTGGALRMGSREYTRLGVYYKGVKEICKAAIKCSLDMGAEDEGEAFSVAEKYIKEHFREQIVIRDIAKSLYTSPGYLGTVFSKKMGVSIKEYLHALRMEEAVRLMTETDMPLSEIAYSVGYNNYNNFYHRFERFFGMTPKEYRRVI